MNMTPGDNKLASLATGRDESLFAEDIQRSSAVLRERISGKRILVIGGAGSIGSSTVRSIVPFAPAALHVVDQNENIRSISADRSWNAISASKTRMTMS
jgi:FlaA1/EpsC-like NDP-sugar epimerase